MLKMAVFAPMPSAMIKTATEVNPGLLSKCLIANFRSWASLDTAWPPAGCWKDHANTAPIAPAPKQRAFSEIDRMIAVVRVHVRTQCSQAYSGLRIFRLMVEFRSLGFENAGDCGGAALPLLGFSRECFAAFGCEAVVLGAAIVFSGAPFGFDVTGAFHAAECREERAGIDAEDAAADLLDTKSHSVAVHGLEGESFQDQHLERALDQVAVCVGFRHC